MQQSLIQQPIIKKYNNINSSDNNNLMETEELQPVVNKDLIVEVILKLILDDDTAFPKWVGNNFNQFRLNNVKLISPPEDMVQILKHIPMPFALHGYNEFQNNMNFNFSKNDDDNNNNNNSSSSSNSNEINNELQEGKSEIQNDYVTNDGMNMEVDVIMRDESNEAESAVDKFFSNMDKTTNSSISLCKLADINHRLKRARRISDDKISRQIQIEKDRNELYTKDLNLRKEHIKNYIDGSRETEVYSFVKQLKVGLARIHQELPKHIDVVEQYKALVDEIKSSNNLLAETIDSIRTYYSSILSQRESILKICEFRFEVESYNILTSEQRLMIYKRLETYIDNIYNVIMKDQVEKAISLILEALINNKIKVSSKSNVALNTCIEAVNLWKKYAGDNVNFASKFLTLEKKIKKELKSVSNKATDKSSYPKIDKNTTVVLYFNSNLSEGNHSQYSNRLNDCLDSLMKILKNENSSESNKGLQRTLKVLDTSNVSSSPAWCLYLTHSAQYLSKLFETVELSEKNNNSKFPLVFNTHTFPKIDIPRFDDRSPSSKTLVKTTLRSSDRNKEEKLVPECISEIIDDEESALIFQQLQQIYGDETISKLTVLKEEEENELIGSKRKRTDNSKLYKKSRPSDEKPIEIGNLVTTPYGEGRVLLVTKNKYNDDIGVSIKVKFKWGTGYFNNPDDVTVVEAFKFIEKLTYKQQEELIFQANDLIDKSQDDEGKTLGKIAKLVNQNKLLYNYVVLLIKNGIGVSLIAKALGGISHSLINSWMIGKETPGTSRVEHCLKRWLYYFDVDAIIEKRISVEVDYEDDIEDSERKSNQKEEMVIDLSSELGQNGIDISANGIMFTNMTDTLHINKDDMNMALKSAGIACRAIDIVMTSMNTNVFCCTHPPGHHVSRHGPTSGCFSTGFGLLNNAAIASYYARINWGIEKIAIVDIDANFGNGTSEIFQGDNRTFFGSVHMIYGMNNEGIKSKKSYGFFPASLGCSNEVNENYISIGVQSDKLIKSNNGKSGASDDNIHNLSGPRGFRKAVDKFIVNKMELFKPELLIICSGFNGYHSDPFGGELGLDLDDYEYTAKVLVKSMEKINGVGKSKIISILEGGYDISDGSQGLSNCINAFVKGLRI